MASFSVAYPLSYGVGSLLMGSAVEVAGYIVMFLSAAALSAAGLAFAPGLASRASDVAARVVHAPVAVAHVTAAGWIDGGISSAGAIALALVLLYRRRLPAILGAPLRRPCALLHAVHSGVIGDYAAWLAGGAALFAVVWGATLR